MELFTLVAGVLSPPAVQEVLSPPAVQPILPPEPPQDVGAATAQQKLVVLASYEHIVADAAAEKGLRIGTRKDVITGRWTRAGGNNAIGARASIQ